MKTTVLVKTSFEALHSWPSCNIPEVYFLGNPHHHVFDVVAEVEVQRDDREVEFFVLKSQVDEQIDIILNLHGYKQGMYFYTPMSCEMMCKRLLEYMPALVSVEVWEDGKRGARVIR